MSTMNDQERHATADDQKRYTVVINRLAQSRLGSIAKQFKISQGAVMEVLIENADTQALEAAFVARREAKVSSRVGKSALIEQLNSLTPEQKAYLESLAKQQKKEKA